MFFPGLGLSLLFSIALCLHVARTGQSLWWMVIILILQPLGGIVYLALVVAPELLGSARTQRFGAEAARALDPAREHRIARRAAEESPTVHNRLRLAKAAQALGRHAEAEEVFGKAMVGIHADDPVLILGRATSLIELGRIEEAQALMVKLDELGEEARTPAAALAWARILEALGRSSEAERAYRDAAERLPGLEALGRYAAFLARNGREEEAHEQVREIDMRLKAASPKFRREGRTWRDLARHALASRI